MPDPEAESFVITWIPDKAEPLNIDEASLLLEYCQPLTDLHNA